MKPRLVLGIIAFFGVTGSASAQYYNYGTGSNPESHQTQGHFRSNGTYVAPYHSTNPDSSHSNNYGAYGNYNPYSGPDLARVLMRILLAAIIMFLPTQCSYAQNYEQKLLIGKLQACQFKIIDRIIQEKGLYNDDEAATEFSWRCDGISNEVMKSMGLPILLSAVILNASFARNKINKDGGSALRMYEKFNYDGTVNK